MNHPVIHVVEVFKNKAWMHAGPTTFDKRSANKLLKACRFQAPKHKFRLAEYARIEKYD